MLKFIVKRIIGLVPILFLVGLISFLLIHFAPGDSAIASLGVEATPERIAQLREAMGLDRPLWIQFLDWLRDAVRGDLGRSLSLNMNVTEAIVQRVPATFSLSVFGYFVALLIGIPTGMIAAIKHNTWFDQTVMSLAVLGISLPSFVMGLLLVMVFSLQLGMFPSGGYVPFLEDPIRALHYMALPALAVGVFQAALLSRMTRSSVLEVMRQDYVRTARGKGLAERVVITRHALRNALVPILTVAGMGFGSLLGGVVATETVFTYPGLGRLAVFAIQRRDYPLVLGVVLMATTVYVLINLLVDIAYAWSEPRIRYE